MTKINFTLSHHLKDRQILIMLSTAVYSLHNKGRPIYLVRDDHIRFFLPKIVSSV
jgi:hypothetical protein